MSDARSVVRRLVIAAACGAVGLVAGYYAGALVGCLVLWPGKNLCGLPVIATAPLGLAAGVGVAWRRTRRVGGGGPSPAGARAP
jgi:hypothetical protein